jgi:hypothetical protein
VVYGGDALRIAISQFLQGRATTSSLSAREEPRP